MMLPLAIGLDVTIYERGTLGEPTTTFVENLNGRIVSYSHSITHQFGFETMTCSFACTLEEAVDWLSNGLMRSVVVTGPDVAPWEQSWAGYLETIEAQIGQERRSVSLREMANRIRVGYQTVLGTQGVRPTSTTFFQDTDSISSYGRKDLALALGNTSDGTEVDDYGNVMLRKLSTPLAAPTSTVASGDLGAIQLTLTFAGWYAALDWLLTSNTSMTKTVTSTQLATLLAAYIASNNFLSASTDSIDNSGVTATEYIEADTTYRAKFEALLARGNGANPFAWGVYERREFHAGVWAGASPTTIAYRRPLGESLILDENDVEVVPWNVRPDTMYQVVELIDVVPVATQQDAAGRFYVARVTCSIGEGQISVQLEPEQSSSLEAVLITRYL